MKKILLYISILFLIHTTQIFSQTATNAEVYLLTCGPGIETYSIYGHSALRILIPEKKSDVVYNWGIFDFSTPHFAWKFAKGRLDYMLGVTSMQGFLQIYQYEQRSVISQRVNLTAEETDYLISLVNDNLKPENVNYRYDFFYDNCSTRIRDILEKSVGEKLLYPPEDEGKNSTFRDMICKYQNPYPWLRFGVDMLVGSRADKKANFRDRMFLPVDMQNGLSKAVIRRDGKMIPLLQNPDVILDFNPPEVKQHFFTSPVFVFTLLLIIIIILSALLKSRKLVKLVDISIFSVFSILCMIIIFFNFFSDHQQLKWNLNIIWLNPLLLICLILLILNSAGSFWFRIVFLISVSFLALQIFLPQEFNVAFMPLVLIIIVRSSTRSGFEWNPYTLK